MFLQQRLDVNIATTELRQKYVPIVHQVLNRRSIIIETCRSNWKNVAVVLQVRA